MLVNDLTTIEFPCEYPIKVIAENFLGIESFILDILQSNNISYLESSFCIKLSREGKYCSVRVCIIATGESQLETLNKAIMSEPRVRLVL